MTVRRARGFAKHRIAALQKPPATRAPSSPRSEVVLSSVETGHAAMCPQRGLLNGTQLLSRTVCLYCGAHEMRSKRDKGAAGSLSAPWQRRLNWERLVGGPTLHPPPVAQGRRSRRRCSFSWGRKQLLLAERDTSFFVVINGRRPRAPTAITAICVPPKCLMAPRTSLLSAVFHHSGRHAGEHP